MSDPSACDTGCDEYGYPVRVPVSPAGYAAGEGIQPYVPNFACDNSPVPNLVAYLRRRIRDLETENEVLSQSLAALTPAAPVAPVAPAPTPRTMPARALFCRTPRIGIR